MNIGSKTVCGGTKISWGTGKHCRSTYLSAEAAEERIPAMAQCKCKVLVEKVSEELAHAVVGPSTMYQ